MRTRGPTHLEHLLAWSLTHATDAEKQKLQKGGKAAKRVQRKYEKIAKNWARKMKLRLPEAASPSKSELRFPTFEGGFEVRRMNLGPNWTENGPPPGSYETFRKGDEEAIYLWTERVGGWHSGYKTESGNQYFKTPESKQPGVPKDYRFHYETATVPLWDTKALAFAAQTGDISSNDVVDLVMAFLQWVEVEGAKLISCGAQRQLVPCGASVHLEDGSIHVHTQFLKTSPLAFRRRDGTLQPRQLAPRGRPKAGEGWVGGDRLGLTNAEGKLVTNPLGPAMCAADAMKEAGFSPPPEYGNDWKFLETTIQRRMEGGFFGRPTETEAMQPGGKGLLWRPDLGVTAGKGSG